jgi:hypothetical protein
MKFFNWLKLKITKPKKKPKIEISRDLLIKDPHMIIFNELFNIIGKK